MYASTPRFASGMPMLVQRLSPPWSGKLFHGTAALQGATTGHARSQGGRSPDRDRADPRYAARGHQLAREGANKLTGPPRGCAAQAAYFWLGELMSRSTPPCVPHALVLDTQAPSLQ
jgi:hypothetical protein